MRERGPSAASAIAGRWSGVARSRGPARGAAARAVRAAPRRMLAPTMQTEVVKLALDLLVREPDIEGFFGALTKTMVEESESHTCARLAARRESASAASSWIAYVEDRLFTLRTHRRPIDELDRRDVRASRARAWPRHLFDYTPGWSADDRVPRRRSSACPRRSATSASSSVWDTVVVDAAGARQRASSAG